MDKELKDILRIVSKDLDKAFLPWKVFFSVLLVFNLVLLILAIIIL